MHDVILLQHYLIEAGEGLTKHTFVMETPIYA